MFTVGRALTIATLGTIGVTAAIVAAPHLLPFVGVTGESVGLEAVEMIHDPAGIAGGINTALSSLPYVGKYLAEGGLINAAASGVVGIGGVMLGDFMASNSSSGETISWGKIIKYGALTTSAMIALPTVLSALSAGIIYAAIAMADAGIIESSVDIIGAVSSSLGSVGQAAGSHSAMLGASGIAAAIPHLITCGASLVPAALSVKLLRDDIKEKKDEQKREQYTALDTKGNPLPAHDANHHISEDEQSLVEIYNNATSVQKIIMQKELRVKGYDPDFHADGTVHLHKHEQPSMQASAAR